MPRARNGAAISSARGNWLDWTPTSITMPAPARSIIAREASGTDARVGLVESVDFEFDVRAENGAFGAILRKPIERGERVRGNWRAKPLDDVAVVVVMRRLDEHQAEAPPRTRVQRNRQIHIPQRAGYIIIGPWRYTFRPALNHIDPLTLVTGGMSPAALGRHHADADECSLSGVKPPRRWSRRPSASDP